MCGIAGLYHLDTAKPVDPARLRAMLHPMAHRGPDGTGVWTAPGVGLGYQFLQFDATTLSFDGGVSYVNERHEVETDRNYWAARETGKFEHSLLPGRLQLFHQHDGYFGLSGGENWFVQTRSGARINLMSGIIMTGELGLNYDRRPAVGQNHFDRMFAITLGYELGF